MEKEKFFTSNGTTIPSSWNSIFGMEIQSSELNSSSEQIPNCFFNPNWDNSMDQGDPFESALSSMVSSPANSNAGIAIPANGNGDSIVLRELIGRLGSIYNSGEVSPHSYMNGNTSTNTSCYNTPLNSPPKLNLSIMDHHHHHHQTLIGNLPIPAGSHHQLPLSADPGFAERAARFSRMKEPAEFPPVMESRKLPRGAVQEEPIPVLPSPIPGVSDSKKFGRLSVQASQENAELGDSMEESSVSEQIPSQNNANANARKRKSVPKGKAKETPSNSIPSPKDDNKVGGEKEESSGKRSKGDEEEGNVKEKGGKSGNQKQTKENSKPPEPPKDYIHVRARRGQATDSHSLAERVRREKISERMKFLQDLVPGCNKVTGKAVMLDEIINYVQSLQRQVEFLSMKLATVNPRMDMTMEALLSKDIRGTLSHNMHPLDASPQPFPYGFQSQLNGILPNGTDGHFSMINPLTAGIHRNSSMKQPQMDGFVEAAAAQVSSFWENDLQSVVQMGLGQNQPQALHGTMGTSQMKVEL